MKNSIFTWFFSLEFFRRPETPMPKIKPNPNISDGNLESGSQALFGVDEMEADA